MAQSDVNFVFLLLCFFCSRSRTQAFDDGQRPEEEDFNPFEEQKAESFNLNLNDEDNLKQHDNVEREEQEDKLLERLFTPRRFGSTSAGPKRTKTAREILEEQDRKLEEQGKTRLFSYVHMHIKCDLPKQELLGTASPSIEILRFRVYEASVAPAVWKALQNHLWELVYRTPTIKNTNTPEFNSILITTSALCHGELERPIRLRVIFNSCLLD